MVESFFIPRNELHPTQTNLSHEAVAVESHNFQTVQWYHKNHRYLNYVQIMKAPQLQQQAHQQAFVLIPAGPRVGPSRTMSFGGNRKVLKSREEQKTQLLSVIDSVLSLLDEDDLLGHSDEDAEW